MDSASDVSGDDVKSEISGILVHRERVGADPTEGWRRGTRGELRKSCDACTASKTKCCGDIPCNRCIKKGLECKFSKRKRCGPKAREPDGKEDKRPRIGPYNDSDKERDSGDASTGYASGHYREHSPPPLPSATRYSPMSSSSRATGTPLSIAENSHLPNMHSHLHLPTLPPAHTEGGELGAFNAPLTADGLSGLVKLIAPSLSDGGNSASSGLSGLGGPAESSVFQDQPGRSSSHGQAPTHHLPRFMSRSCTPTISETAGAETSCAAANTMNVRQMHSVRDSSSPSLSAVMVSNPVSKLRTEALLESDNGIGESMGGTSSTAAAAAAGAGASTTTTTTGRSVRIRGPLPMERPSPRARAYLATFLRSVGCLLPLPGTETLQAAMERWGGDADAGGDEMDARPGASMERGFSHAVGGSGRRRARPHARRNSGGGGGAVDDTTDQEYSEVRLPSRHWPGGGGGDGSGRRSSGEIHVGSRDRNADSGNVELDEACRAEAWAAIAVGALFSGAADGEAREFAARSLRALPRCFDAPLAEVASVFMLHTLFWLHSLEKRKVARYFGFAQQVVVEVRPLMPEEVQHSMAFVSVLVSMTIHRDEATALGIRIEDPSFWGLSGSRLGVSPQLRGLEAVTMACSTILKEQCLTERFGTVNATVVTPKVVPSKGLTDMLSTAAGPLQTLGIRDSSQSSDHLLALLSGLQGYTHARRGETAQAQLSARLTLEAFSRDRSMMHLPLTQTLVDAAERVVESVSGRFGTAPPAWCPFAQELLRAAGNDISIPSGSDLAVKGSSVGICGASSAERRSPASIGSRAGSMSPPPDRSLKPALSRAELASRTWRASVPDANTNRRADSIGTLLETSPRVAQQPINIDRANSLHSRWSVSSPILVSRPDPPTITATENWVERVRFMSSSPTIVRRPPPGAATAGPGAAAVGPACGRSPSPLDHAPVSSGPGTTAPREDTRSPRQPFSDGTDLILGSMPESSPRPSRRYASEPAGVGLSLLAGAASGPSERGYLSHEVIKTEMPEANDGEREQRGRGGRGGGRGGGGSVVEETSREEEDLGDEDLEDDPPPSSVPLMKNPFSFDPNREDPQLNAMLY